MKELIEKLRNPTDGLRYNDGNGLLKEAADEIERLTAENLRLAGEVSNRNSRALAGDTATKQFDAMYEDIESLTAELNSIKEKNAPEIGSINAYITNLTSERDAALAASRYETDLCQQALDTVKEVQAEVDRTIAERDALRADAERLNWMEDALKCYFFQIQSQPSGAYVVQGYGKKLRAAIDAAIAGEKK